MNDPRQHKRRQRRNQPVPAEGVVVVRGDVLAAESLRTDAADNHEMYGFYGISVFAETAEVPWTDLAATRFAAVPWLVLFTAGDLEAAGLELWDTGLAPYYDVVHADLGQLVARMLGTAHRVVPNPHHRTGG